MNCLHAIILPLAQAEDFGKVVIGILFAALWIVVQVVASAGSQKKKREAAERQRMGQSAPLPSAIPTAPPPARSVRRDATPLPPRGSQASRPARQRHGGKADHLIEKADARPSPPWSRAGLVDASAGSTAPVGSADVAAGEIGGAGGPAASASVGRRVPARARRVDALLRPGTLGDVFLAAEILRPPVALRENDGAGQPPAG